MIYHLIVVTVISGMWTALFAVVDVLLVRTPQCIFECASVLTMYL